MNQTGKRGWGEIKEERGRGEGRVRSKDRIKTEIQRERGGRWERQGREWDRRKPEIKGFIQ